MHDRTNADDIVQGAANRALLSIILPSMRIAAKGCGYAITVHGSLDRDIDLVAVPWIESAKDKENLALAIRGAVASVTGNCLPHGDWDPKPHGRIGRTFIVYCGEAHMMLDISIMPPTTTQNQPLET